VGHRIGPGDRADDRDGVVVLGSRLGCDVAGDIVVTRASPLVLEGRAEFVLVVYLPRGPAIRTALLAQIIGGTARVRNVRPAGEITGVSVEKHSADKVLVPESTRRRKKQELIVNDGTAECWGDVVAVLHPARCDQSAVFHPLREVAALH